MLQDLMLRVAELEGKHSIQVNEQAIRAEQESTGPTSRG
jgi:hypothetical protein